MGGKPTTSAKIVGDKLREHILEGVLAPGRRLQQEELATMLGVSRTPLRTALAELTQEGLLEYVPNRGYTVRAFRLEEIRAAFQVRAVLEATACRLVALEGLSERTVDRLERCVEQGDRILAKGRLDPGDLAPYRQMNVGYHEAILEAAANPWLRDFVHRTHNVPLTSDRIILWEDFGIIQRSHDDHHRIIRALRQRDPERAWNLMWEHVTFAGEVLCEHLERRKQFVPARSGRIDLNANPIYSEDLL